jgi:cell wall-associated NlpC family hydrolase
MWRLVAATAAAGCLLLPAIAPSPASASTTPNYGGEALNWAEVNATGHWYAYGANGPVTYDCSGLVSTAILKATGIWIGRDTAIQLDTMGEGHFVSVPVSDAVRGDVLFYGPDHEEFDTNWYHTSFGAHDTGSQIGWIEWGWGWVPTMAFKIVK